MSKKNIDELELLYSEKEKEVVMLQKYLDECQVINTRLRQIADKNDSDIQHILKERDLLRDKLSDSEKQISALRRLLKQSERLLKEEASLKIPPSPSSTEKLAMKSVNAQLRQTLLENEQIKEQNAHLKDKLHMLEKFQSTFNSPSRSLDLLKSLNSKHSDLYMLSEEKSPPQRLPSLPVTSEGHSAKLD